MKYGEVAAQVGCNPKTVTRILAVFPRPPRKRNPLRLSPVEREEIARGLQAKESLRSIARRLARAPSTVCREVTAVGRASYRAWRGEARAETLCVRPKPRKLEVNRALAAAVELGLAKNWSPEQIAHALNLEHADDPAMNVSHETIYKALYVQGRGSLRQELSKHLRTARKQRKQRGRKDFRGHIRDMVSISQRPPEVEDRAVPGHWEGDLILGKNLQSAIGTLVERQTRYVMLLHLPLGRTANEVRKALSKKIQTLPEELRRSVTWDQGKEMAEHTRFTIETGVKVFFCDPSSPWQRGSNENTNGLLRQYFPKGDDLSQFSARELNAVAQELNERPRQTLEWKTPLEKLAELLR
jgi:IS30 family transposase